MTILISIVAEAYSSQFKIMIRTESIPDDVSTAHGSGSRQIRFPDSMVNAGTEELLSPRPASAILSATSGHHDLEPSLGPIRESGSWKPNNETLHEILRRAQSLRTLIAPEKWPGDANSFESTSNTADFGAPHEVALSNSQGQGREVYKCQIEESTQEIIAATLALEVLNGAGETH